MGCLTSNYSATTIRLANRYFQDKGRDSNEKNSQQVRDEPLEAIVVVKNTRVSKQVALAGATTHGSEKKSCSRRPLITTIFALRSRRR